MTGGYWYVEGGNGERFAWAKTPTYSCPFRAGPPGWFGSVLAESEDADELPTIDAIERMFRRAHGTYQSGSPRARDGNGRLTDRCSACGAKLTRHGFAAWAERDRGSTGISERLGIALVDRIGENRYFRTKKRAEAWARREADKSRRKAKVTT